MLDAAHALAPEIASRADEIEKARRVPADLIDKLRSIGAFRALIPRHIGGEELSVLEFIRVLEEVARADGSTAWTVLIGADFPIVLSKFSAEVLKEIYADGPDTLARGAFAPKGVAVKADGGYIVSGQWPLASGSYDFQWVIGNCVVLGDNGPVFDDTGVPEMRAALMRPDQVAFLDTWDSVGLRATSSDDFRVSEQFVPEAYAANIFGPSPSWDTTLYRLPMRIGLGPTHSGVAIGIARGALEDLAELSKTKRPAFNPMARLAEDPVFRQHLGHLRLRLDAVRRRCGRKPWPAPRLTRT
jgi:alkylation response protein AidB-like acyl-CoA dehydrogenase